MNNAISNLSQANILYFEPEKVLREITENILVGFFKNVYSFENVDLAINYFTLNKDSLNFIICSIDDYMEKRENSFIARVRTLDYNFPIYAQAQFTTKEEENYSTEEKFFNFLKLHINSFVAKPIDMKELLDVCAILFEKTSNYKTSIENKIEFKPEYKQAGISILNYFSEILNTKYPNIDTSVSIIQKDNIIKMIIRTPEGHKEIIEQTLNTYMAVVKQQVPVEKLLDNKYEILKLNNKLEVAQLEVKQTNNLLRMQKENYQERIQSLEQQIITMKDIMDNQLEYHNKTALLQHDTIKKFLKNISNNKELVQNYQLLIQKIDDTQDKEIEKNDINDIKETIEQLKKNNPNETKDLLVILEQTMYGVTSNSIFQFIQLVLGKFS